MHDDDQGRSPPAFQEYAATLMSTMAYRAQSLAERGLAWSMRLECWVNSRLPADPVALARILGYPQDEVRRALTKEVMFFFRVEGDYLTCPELDAYKGKLVERRFRQSEGGKYSAAKINSKRSRPQRRANTGVEGKQSGNSQLTSEQAGSSSVQSSTKKQSQEQFTNTVNKDSWVFDLEKAEQAAAYTKASRG